MSQKFLNKHSGIKTLSATLNEAITCALKEDWKKTKGDACLKLTLDKLSYYSEDVCLWLHLPHGSHLSRRLCLPRLLNSQWPPR